MRIVLRNVISLTIATLVAGPALARSAATGSFTLVQPMNQYRNYHTATLLANGRVLIAGGTPFGQATTTSELYDPETQTWTNSGKLNGERALHTATLLRDGRLVLAGGQSASLLLASTEVYDPATG